jgi:hypothetical protein
MTCHPVLFLAVGLPRRSPLDTELLSGGQGAGVFAARSGAMFDRQRLAAADCLFTHRTCYITLTHFSPFF